MTGYVQETLFGTPETVEIEQEYRPSQEEINEYYKTHTLLETVRHFHCRPNKLNIDPELKKGRRGAGIDRFATEMKVVFLKTVAKKSDFSLQKQLGIHHSTIKAIERRNKPLKNLFEEHMLQLGNDFIERLLSNKDVFFDGMENILIEATSKKKIKAADFKELVDGWAKFYSCIMQYVPRENVTDSGDVDAKEQLMSAIADAIKSNKMDKATAESIYYQPEEESIPSDEQKDEEEE